MHNSWYSIRYVVLLPGYFKCNSGGKAMNRIRNQMLLCAVILLVFGFAQATIINVPEDQPTIQAGINAAVNGDTVLVQPYTYVENINFIGKEITVGSLFLITEDTQYISQTVIDGDSSGTVVTFDSGESYTAVLSGFSVTNGGAVDFGGGISCSGSNPTLENLIVEGNIALAGGGLYCTGSANPQLKNSTVSGKPKLSYM